MIVYFFKKSKKQIIKWGTVLDLYLLVVYAFYIQKMLLLHEVQTLQLIRNEDKILIETINNQEKSKTSQYPFVASKKGVYYYPVNCSKAHALSVKNMLYFKDKIAAEVAGYKAHLSCF